MLEVLQGEKPLKFEIGFDMYTSIQLGLVIFCALVLSQVIIKQILK